MHPRVRGYEGARRSSTLTHPDGDTEQHGAQASALCACLIAPRCVSEFVAASCPPKRFQGVAFVVGE